MLSAVALSAVSHWRGRTAATVHGLIRRPLASSMPSHYLKSIPIAILVSIYHAIIEQGLNNFNLCHHFFITHVSLYSTVCQ